MKLAISGASGNVGRKIIPLLLAKGIVPLLVGRDPDKLMALFPGCEAVAYDGIPEAARNFDLFVHLAAMNNNVSASYEAFEQVNVDLTMEACRKAREAGVSRFVFVSSTHALDPDDTSSYAQSKRAASEQLSEITGMDVCVLYLPAVVGDRFSGRLSPLNALPRPIARMALSVLSALKPTVHAEKVADTVVKIGSAGTAPEKEMLVTNDQQKNAVYVALKRVMDFSAAVCLILFLGWLMAIVWVLIRLDSPGPSLFKQVRVGRNEQPFVCYKFRTMHVSTPQKGTHEISASSVTKIGNFLRRTKLDELPQALNLLRNEMSLVGPRPCLPNQTELVVERRNAGIFQTKPGITGLAQLNGVDMSDPQKLVKWDRRYLDTQGILLDLRLILATALGKGSGDRTQN